MECSEAEKMKTFITFYMTPKWIIDTKLDHCFDRWQALEANIFIRFTA